MFLDLEAAGCQMKLVYNLSKDLEEDQERIKLVQALTLNSEKPRLGLKGSHGLFGADEWWTNVKKGFKKNQGLSGVWESPTKTKMKTSILSGIIVKTYFAGQDSRWGDQVNSFKLKLNDGSIIDEDIYPKLKSDRKLFVTGAKVLIAYVYDKLKKQPASNGGVNYADMVVEMAVSKKPAV